MTHEITCERFDRPVQDRTLSGDSICICGRLALEHGRDYEMVRVIVIHEYAARPVSAGLDAGAPGLPDINGEPPRPRPVQSQCCQRDPSANDNQGTSGTASGLIRACLRLLKRSDLLALRRQWSLSRRHFASLMESNRCRLRSFRRLSWKMMRRQAAREGLAPELVTRRSKAWRALNPRSAKIARALDIALATRSRFIEPVDRQRLERVAHILESLLT
jgi:hypothetical protein